MPPGSSPQLNFNGRPPAPIESEASKVTLFSGKSQIPTCVGPLRVPVTGGGLNGLRIGEVVRLC